MKHLPVSSDLFSEAIQCSFLIEGPAESAGARLLMTETLASAGLHDMAHALLPDLLLSIRHLTDDRERAFLLRRFIEMQNALNFLDEAGVTIKLLDFDADQRQAALKSLATALAGAGRLEEAYRLAEDIEELRDFEAVLEATGSRLAEEGRFDEAFEVVPELETEEARLRLLRRIAAKQGHDEAVETLQKCLKLAESFEDGAARCYALVGIANDYIDRRQIAEAHSLLADTAKQARLIGDAFHRAEIQRDLGAALFRLQRDESGTEMFREALTSIKSIQNAYSRTEKLSEFAALLADLGQTEPSRRVFSLALTAAQEIADPAFRLGRLAKILRDQAASGFSDAAMQTWQQLEIFADQDRDATPMDVSEVVAVVALGEIARSLLRIPMPENVEEAKTLFRQALDRAGKIVEPHSRTIVLMRLAELSRGLSP